MTRPETPGRPSFDVHHSVRGQRSQKNKPDAAAAEKHQLGLTKLIIIIILRYSKDVQLPFQAEQEESSDELLLWYSEAHWDWSPA